MCTVAALLPAAAQSLALSPGEIRHTFEPARPFEFQLAVSNEGAAPLSLQAVVTDFWFNEKNEKTFGRAGTSPRSAANWIEVVPRSLTLAPRGTGYLRAIVTPPAQVSGGFYAVIFLESKPELEAIASREQNKAVYTNIRLGALVLLDAANTEQYGVEVSHASITPPQPNRALKVDFQLRNTGNTHVFPQAKIAILDSRRELVGKTEAESKRFLPSQADQMSASYTGSLTPGAYTAVLTVLYGPDQLYTTDLPFVVSSSDSLASVRAQ